MGIILHIIRELFPKNESEIGQKPVDYFSLLHIIFGYFTYLVVFFIMNYFPLSNDLVKLFALIGSLYVAIMWEFIENFLIDNTKFKHNRKKDSLINSLTDIIFTHFGSLIAMLIDDFLFIGMMIVNLLILAYTWKNETKEK